MMEQVTWSRHFSPGQGQDSFTKSLPFPPTRRTGPGLFQSLKGEYAIVFLPFPLLEEENQTHFLVKTEVGSTWVTLHESVAQHIVAIGN